MEMRLPVARHLIGGAGHGLILGVRPRLGKPLAGNHFFLPIVVEPRFPRLKAGDDRVPRGMECFEAC